MESLLTSIDQHTAEAANIDYTHAVNWQNEESTYKEHGVNFVVPEEYTVDAQGNKSSNLTSFQAMNKNVKDYLSGEGGKDADATQLSWLGSYGAVHGAGQYYTSKEDYLDAHANDIAAGKQVQSYSDYIQGIYNSAQANAEEEWKKYANCGAIGATTEGFDNKADAWFDLTLWGASGSQKDIHVETGSQLTGADASGLNALWEKTATDPMRNSGYRVVLTTDDRLYISPNGSHWYEVLDQGANLVSNEETRPSGLINYAKIFRSQNYRKYETGGLADFTGPAWLDGTKSRPEYILNAAQTERFFSLVDVLEKYEPNEKSGKSGDNYFEIEINVEKLENDYDVEKVADKIRRMIYEDASYRNVNAINHIR